MGFKKVAIEQSRFERDSNAGLIRPFQTSMGVDITPQSSITLPGNQKSN